MLGVAVGKNDQVGAAEDRWDLGVLDEAGEEANAAGSCPRGDAQRLDLHARVADDPELGALDLGEGLEQQVETLVGAKQAEEEDHRLLGTLELSRQRLLLGQAGEVIEGAVGDDPDTGGVETNLVTQAGRAVLGMDDNSVHAGEEAPGDRDLAAAGTWRQDVVGCEQARPLLRQQVSVKGGHGEPLVVDDVSAEVATQAPHVAEVLHGLEGPATGGLETSLDAAAIEALAYSIAIRLGKP